MRFRLFGITIKIDYLLLSLIALFSFFDKWKIMLLALSAAFLHEIGHIIAAQFLGGCVKELYFTVVGVRMKTKRPLHLLSFYKKIVVLSAGCIVNGTLCLFFALFNLKSASIVHILTAVFNILPVGTLDGGRILEEILGLKFDCAHVDKICDIVSICLSIIMLILGSFVLVYSGYNVSLIITSFYLVFNVLMRQKRLN